MKIKLVATLILVVLLLLGWPVCSLASSQIDTVSVGDSDVSAIVEAQYDFSVPEDTTILYPQTSTYLGEFVIEDLLLVSGETLNVNLVAWPMTKTSSATEALPYTVTFSAPDNFDAAQIGESYGIEVSVDDSELSAAEAGTYRAQLMFQVVSSISNMVVWEGPVYVGVFKRGESSGGDDEEDVETQDDADVQGDEQISIDNQIESSDGQEDNGGQSFEDVDEDTNASEEKEIENLGVEEIPAVFYRGSWYLWVLGVGGTLFILILILLFINRRKKASDE